MAIASYRQQKGDKGRRQNSSAGGVRKAGQTAPGEGISDAYWAYSHRNYTQDYALDSILVRSTRHIKQTHSASRTQ